MTRYLLPRTLFGRLLFGILFSTAATIIIFVLLFLQTRREFVFWGDGRGANIERIAQMSREVSELPPSERTAAIVQFQEDVLEFADFYTDPERERPQRGRPDVDELARNYERDVAAALGDGFAVSVERSGRLAPDTIDLGPRRPPPLPAGSLSWPNSGEQFGEPGGPGRRGGRGRGNGDLDITVLFDDGYELTFRADPPRAPPPGSNATFIQLGILTALLAIASLFAARTITRPLSDLATAADSIGRGHKIEPLKERGSRELRETTRAFNNMQERLHRYQDSRADTVAAMSHDLRTPLTRLRLRLEKIQDEELRGRCAEDLDEMNKLISGNLEFFRALNDDGADAPMENVDIVSVCERLVSEFSDFGHDIKLRASGKCIVSARPQALRRCLSNLIGNAVRFGENVTVEVTGAQEAVVTVSDDGPGIPEDELENVFRPYYRVETSRNRATGGTGLGLSIARDIAQSHGGTLTLRNLSPGLEARLSIPAALR